MKNFDSIMPWDTMFVGTKTWHKFRRIERLNYFLECYLDLRNQSKSGSYYEKIIMRCKSLLNDLGVVITDVTNKHYENEV